ncbi:hypothetical protein [uncultured Chryseobacterium sp.]|uniref:hypothetical protein n=1 Tax=uncultured Chryseobacterium sp. TaxID=259322 RepID=UPI0025EACDBB|nr:hypothetical protein [uncultured Chryseobacterium sp.]
MNKTILLVLAVVLTILTGCERRYEADTYRWGNDNMTRVQGYDRNGNLMEYFIAASMYNSLMRQGGETAVNNYYYSHRSTIDRNYSRYKTGYSSYTRSRAVAERKRSILNSIRNRQRARNTVEKSIASGKMKSRSSFFSFKKKSSSFSSSSSGRSSFRSSSRSRRR